MAETSEREQRMFEKAKKVPRSEFSGWVTDGGEFYRDVKDIDDSLDCALEADDGTHFFWATREERPHVDLARECADSWLDDHHENAFEQVNMTKLAEAQKLVDEALSKVTTYWEDERIAVIVEAPVTGGTGQDG
jgi:hypothetical protein